MYCRIYICKLPLQTGMRKIIDKGQAKAVNHCGGSQVMLIGYEYHKMGQVKYGIEKSIFI